MKVPGTFDQAPAVQMPSLMVIEVEGSVSVERMPNGNVRLIVGPSLCAFTINLDKRGAEAVIEAMTAAKAGIEIVKPTL